MDNINKSQISASELDFGTLKLGFKPLELRVICASSGLAQ